MPDPIDPGQSGGGSLLNGAPKTDPGTNNQPFALSKEVWGDSAPEFPEGTDDGIKNEASLKSFVKDGKFNYANVLKSYVHSQKAMGSKVVIPREDGPDAELDEFYSKLGWSKDPSKYQLKNLEVKDGIMPKEDREAFRDMAHKIRLPASQADKLLNFFEEKSKEKTTAMQQARSEEIKKEVEGLAKEWGTAFDRKLNAAKVLIRENGGEELTKYLVSKGLDNDTRLIRMFADLSERFYGEDKLQTEGARNSGFVTEDEAKGEMTEIMNNPAYWDNKLPGHAELVNKYKKLSEVVFKHKE